MNTFSSLTTLGYAELVDIQDIERVLSATEMLGRLMPLNGINIQELVPKERGESVSNSFSKNHGKGSFPLHTDTAFWNVPARFMILFSKKSSPTFTRILSLTSTQALMKTARRKNPIFLRQTVNGPVYSHPWIDNLGCRALYDPCYMKPANRAAEEFEAAAFECGALATRFAWNGANALVIDNWQVLHGREDCNDNDRVLYRFYRGDIA